MHMLYVHVFAHQSLTQTLVRVVESYNFVICPLLHSSVVYFWWRSGEVTNKDRYLGLELTLDKHFSIPIVHTPAKALSA